VTGQSKKRLLVLDDDAGVVDFLCESLTERGFDVIGLTSPKEALLRIKTDAFDLVITDVEMPHMRGTELLAAILAEQPSQLVLLITAFGSIDLAVSTVQSGACDFIAKPFKIEALLAAIERAFHNRQIHREIVRVRRASSPQATEQIVAGSPAMRRVLETAQKAARLCGINLLTQMKAATGGDLDRVVRVVKLGGFVQAGPAFFDIPKVVNGCSDLMVEAFGDAGRHARSAVGVYCLPLNFAVEVDAVVQIR